MATSIGITLQRSILYTLSSFGSYYSPKLSIHAYVQAFKSKLLAYMYGDTTNLGLQNLSIAFTHGNMLGQAT
jgi:hypothetical protein